MNKTNTLISIIVPVYNVQNYLDRCMQSIINQTYKNLEIILVDDGSTDESGKLCDAYAEQDSRIIVIHKVNGGLSDARNAGLKAATGEYIGYVDSDDWIELQMYDTMYKACVKNHADIAICKYHSVLNGTWSETGTDKQTVFTKEELLQAYIGDDDQYVIYNSVWSKLFKRELVKDMIFPAGHNSEDIMYTTKAFCRAEKAVYIDSCFYNYVVDRPDSIMNEKRIQRMFQDELPFWREHIECIQNTVSAELGDYARYYYVRRLLFYYIDYKKERENEAAKKIAGEIQAYKKEIKSLFHKSFAKKADVVRFRCMLLCPDLYYWLDHLYVNMRT